MATMTEETKPVCVGRYLVDVTADAKVELAGSLIDGFDIATVEETEAGFLQRIGARQAELEASQADAATDTDGGMVEAPDLDIPGEAGRGVWLQSVSVESHAHIDGLRISLTAKSKDDPMRPFLSLELRTGIRSRSGTKPIDTAVHEDALLALWDRTAASIRVRKAIGSASPGRRATASSQEVRQLAAH
jgi:hypothetical protein